MFQIKRYILPHDGVIPGGRGHKKIVVPAGTKVYCVVYGTKIFWAAYLDEETAFAVKRSLESSIDGTARRQIPRESLIAWNFKDAIPRRIARQKP